ncbi:MAG: beta-galactosidase GalB [Chitinophagaceae bacterium]
MNVSRIVFAVLALALASGVAAQHNASRASFNEDWKFQLGGAGPGVTDATFDDHTWGSLRLPHDWSIGLPFDKDSPTGTGGGALRGGLGWYRKTFTVPASARGKKLFIDFDGVYMNSEVFINGHSLGVRPNGYISFRYDLTPYLRYGDTGNVIVVKVDNSQQPNSRWYSGSGIYRNVWLTTVNPVYVPQWGVSVTTPQVNRQTAAVRVQTHVRNETTTLQTIRLLTTLYDQNGKMVKQVAAGKSTAAGNTVLFDQELVIQNPSLWSLSNAAMYRAVTIVQVNGRTTDTYTTPFGIRYFRFDVDKGFFLNDQHVKIRGVCMHHDLGCLGTAINTRALERQLEILKAMGCNSIRTSHNPPAPELLELCDKMGFIVMDEAFDMWKKEKNKYDYHLAWDQWHARDLTDLVLRDRNHPSVFMWSVGNEIMEQWGDDTTGRKILRELVGLVKSLDTTRLTVTANNEINAWNNLLQANATDMIGYNYNHRHWDSVQYRWGKKPFIVTESVSALQTRGHYDMPSDSIRRWPVAWDKPLTDANNDLTCSAYENCSTPWGSTHEETLKVFEKYDHISGMYIWTGFDYIGEPTPYPWPARSSYFGIVDLAGFPKDAYYLYQSVWTNKPVLHILPHWTWTPGQTIDVWAYYNQADEAELFLNGRSLGVRKKQGGDLHVMWRMVFEPGVVKVVTRKNGKTVLTKDIRTAGKPAKIILQADRSAIKAGGADLSFITVKVTDKNGNIVPNADHLVRFSVSGPGFIAGTDNGSQTSLESFKSPQRKAFNGLCMALVQSAGRPGLITLHAAADGLQGASINISAK